MVPYQTRKVRYVTQSQFGHDARSLSCHIIYQNFRRHILWRAADAPCFVTNIFGQSKVDNLDMSSVVQQQVFWLEISVDYLERVEVRKSRHNLGCVELGHCTTEMNHRKNRNKDLAK